MLKHFGVCFAAGLLTLGFAQPKPTISGTVTLDLQHPGHSIPPKFFGLMTEEINHAYDGGLYAELVRNRSFRDSNDEPTGWSVSGPTGKITLQGGPTPWVRLDPGANQAELTNSGFWGIPFRAHTSYRLTVRAKGEYGFSQPVKVQIRAIDSKKVLAETTLNPIGSDWKTLHATLRTKDGPASEANELALITSGPGALDLNYVSLFPPTFHNRSNGNRPDLMEKMAGLSPKFLRLPGGNYLEGDKIPTRFEWKDTLGTPMDRIGHQGPWGYRSSDGLGLLEFLEWCEDLKMDPLLAVYAGYSLQGDHVNPGQDLQPFVQDALDEIEYVTGDTHTKWGGQRAKDGHPAPFPLEYVEIGNEDWFDRSRSYEARFAQFFDAIKAKYPRLQLIATGPISSRHADVVDDHYYRTAAEMASDSGHYDNARRDGPKIFVGEWASVEGSPTPTMQAALGDAAWLTGLERDSDLVVMESYAPLLVNVNRGASQWGTNLIGYDALNSFGSPSYWVQSMFAGYTGDVVVPSQTQVSLPPPPPYVPSGGIGLGSWRTQVEYKDAEVTHDGKILYHSDLTSSEGWNPTHGDWSIKDGTYAQTSEDEATLTFAGDPHWQNYTYRVKARKTAGAEGFIVPFHVKDPNNFYQWNVGGWDNSQTRIQRVENGAADIVGSRSNVTVETNRWYDLRIEVEGPQIRCYLDGKLVSQATERPKPTPNPLYVAASRDTKSGHLKLKIVNFSESPLKIDFRGSGSESFAGELKGLVLSGARSDINSVRDSNRVKPRTVGKSLNGSFDWTFGPNSVTVLDFNPAVGG